MVEFHFSPKCSGCYHYWLSHIRLKHLLIMLLLILIVTPLVAHYYISKAEGSSQDDLYRTRIKLDTMKDVSNLKAADLKMRIEELLRIKASVSNELRELEAKRQALQVDISQQQTKVDEQKINIQKLDQEMNLLTLSIEQAKYAHQEALEMHMPDIRAPFKILPELDANVDVAPPRSYGKCQFHTCFDFSRCSLLSGFPVYVYNVEQTSDIVGHVETSVKSSLRNAFSQSPYITSNPSIACVFVVLLADVDTYKLQSGLPLLPYWHGDGRNHILLHLSHGVRISYDPFQGVKTGRAIVAQSNFFYHYFRSDFDMVIPVLSRLSHGDVWAELPPQVPARRKYLLSYQGKYKEPVVSGFEDELKDSHSKSVTFKSDHEQSLVENYIVETLKKLAASSDDNFYFDFSCHSDLQDRFSSFDGEWDLCNNDENRASILQNSTFSLIITPSNNSIVSTALTSKRLFESLKYGAIPVILGSIKLPFYEQVNWQKASFFLPRGRITELHFFLRTVTDNDLLAMRRQGRVFWERYFSSTKAVIDTILAQLRTRLLIPAVPAKDMPSPSVFNSTFKPIISDTLPLDQDIEENVGPIEPAHSSAKFRRNFTWSSLSDTWNDIADPFYLYPYTPFDPILPSEAKFLGSGLGFRPIGKGLGGSGKEFSAALGGNSPREQFTVVMLTYEREAVLINSLARFHGLPHLNKVLVVWNSPKPPPDDLRWPDIGVPILVIKTSKNSLNNRFLPYDAIETEAILSIDDDTHLRHDEIVFAFRVWREARDRIVGFPGRFHAWDSQEKNWRYKSDYSCELSMVLTGAAFFHKYYSYAYSNTMPAAIRDKVDEYINCEDIAFNFLVAHITRKPPIKVTSRWTFHCPGCPVTLYLEDSHFDERHECINFFVKVYGYNPLLYTQFRTDSVLFKTRIPHDKQKCFKYV